MKILNYFKFKKTKAIQPKLIKIFKIKKRKDFIYCEDLEKNPELFKKIIEKDLKEIQEEKETPIKEFVAEMEEKYHFNLKI